MATDRYFVYCDVKAEVMVEVEAKSEEEAKQIAEDSFYNLDVTFSGLDVDEHETYCEAVHVEKAED